MEIFRRIEATLAPNRPAKEEKPPLGWILGGLSDMIFAPHMCAVVALLLTCTQSLAKGGSYRSEERYNAPQIDQSSSGDSRFDSSQIWLTEIRQWISREGLAGQFDGPALRVLGYEAAQSVRQKAFRRAASTHLFYVTSAGDVVLGYVDPKAMILWRIEGAKLTATAHGDVATHKLWRDQNLEHAELFVRELSYWTKKWFEHVQKTEKSQPELLNEEK